MAYPDAFLYQIVCVALEFVFKPCSFGLVLSFGLANPVKIPLRLWDVRGSLDQAFNRFEIAQDIVAFLGFNHGSPERIDTEVYGRLSNVEKAVESRATWKMTAESVHRRAFGLFVEKLGQHRTGVVLEIEIEIQLGLI